MRTHYILAFGILAVALALAACPGEVPVAEATDPWYPAEGTAYYDESTGLAFRSTNNGTEYMVCQDSRVNKQRKEVRIPGKYRGLPVTSIGNGAFSSWSQLTSVAIPASVQSIGGNAFYGCTSLANITIPASVTSIGNYAFEYCTGLTGITIPASVTSIGNGAFGNTKWLTNQPNGLMYAGKVVYGYKGTMPASTVISNIRSDTTGIADRAFDRTSLAGIAIPASARSIGGSAFYECTSLASVTFAEGSQLASIGSEAFRGCSSLASIAIPAGVTSIGGSAFYECTSLASVTFAAGSQLASIGDNAFRNCSSLASIEIPAGVTSLLDGSYSSLSFNYYGVFSGCTSLASVTFAAGSRLESIGSYTFARCSNLAGITIPAGVTSIIGSTSFFGCSRLASITVDTANTVYASEDGILYNKAKTLIIAVPRSISGNVSIPSGVTYIDNSAFSGCSGLAGIEIPASVDSIGNSAFSGCSSLRNIIIDTDKVTSYNNSAFSSSNNWGTIFPANNLSVTFKKNVGDYAFYFSSSNSRLASVTIAEGVTSIGSDAFYNCNSLASITVAANNPNYASQDGILYNKAKTLIIIVPRSISGNVSIPAGVTSIGDYAFSYTSLASIAIPAGVTSIGQGAFSGCTSLASITIPAGVTSIGLWAFSNWTSSQTIYVQGYASQAAADGAWGSSSWRSNCNAVIKYWNGSAWV